MLQATPDMWLPVTGFGPAAYLLVGGVMATVGVASNRIGKRRDGAKQRKGKHRRSSK